MFVYARRLCFGAAEDSDSIVAMSKPVKPCVDAALLAPIGAGDLPRWAISSPLIVLRGILLYYDLVR